MEGFLSDDPSNGFEDGLEEGLEAGRSEDLSIDRAAAREEGFGAGRSVDLDEDLSEYFEDGRDSDRSVDFADGRDEGLSDDLVSCRSEYPDDDLSFDLAWGFGEALNLGFSSPSSNFFLAGFAGFEDLDGACGFLMNLEKSPCLLDFPPGTRGFSESFINLLNWMQR